jgi:hypothetical protein
MKKLLFVLSVLLTGCATQTNISKQMYDGEFPEILRAFEEPVRVNSSNLVVRIFYLPTGTSPICFRIDKVTEWGPVILTLKVTNGQGGFGNYGRLVFEDRKLANPDDYINTVAMRILDIQLASPPLKPKYDLPELDGDGCCVEIWDKHEVLAFQMSSPGSLLTPEYRKLWEGHNDFDKDAFEVDRKTREAFAVINKWLFEQWNLTIPYVQKAAGGS